MHVERTNSVCKVLLTTFAAYDDVEKRVMVLRDNCIKDYKYLDSLTIFTYSTSLTDYRIPEIQAMADSLLNDQLYM